MKKKILFILIALLLLIGCESIDQNVDEFIDEYSASYPYIESLMDPFEVIDNSIALLQDEKSMLIFCFGTELSFEEIEQLGLAYADYLLNEYNTSMSGNMSMENDGYINYNTIILENENFKVSVTNINNVKELKNDNKDDDYLKDIGKANILVTIETTDN